MTDQLTTVWFDQILISFKVVFLSTVSPLHDVNRAVVVLYLAVVQGGCKLVGAQGQLWLLVEVYPPAHVVQMLEVEGWHYSKT